MKIEIGTSYYPENWDRKRIIYDAELMQNAGLSYVRLGEFAWSHIELREGEYHLEWLEEAVQIFGEHGIRSVLCTPSAAVPAWLCKKHPSILRTGRNGEKAYLGVRHHTCYTSKILREYIRKITIVLAEHFKDNPYVAAWQIENEPGACRFLECFCDDCQNEFRRYLREKYRTIENLNKVWRAVFWSGEFSDWNEIDLSALLENTQSCKSLESWRFRSRVQADYVLSQAEIIRERMPGIPIGTNNYDLYDRYEGFAGLDFAGNDLYPNYRLQKMDPFHHKADCALYSGLKPGVSPWIMETPPNPLWPMKDLTNFFFWFYAGYGYNKIFYFPWGNALTNDEKIHLSVVDGFSKTGPQYEAMKKMIAEADSVLKPYPELPLPHSPCAIVKDHDAEWMFSGSMDNRRITFFGGFNCSYKSLCRTADFAEIISPGADWSVYKLLVLPVQNHISKALAQKMKSYVESGGVLVMNGSSGCFDCYGNHADNILPEHVSDLFGIEIGENMPCRIFDPVFENTPDFFRKEPVVKGILDGEEIRGTLSVWTGYLHLKGAETLLSFENSQLMGEPFCTVNRYGKGFAIYYIADRIDQGMCDKIIRFAAKKAGLKPVNYPETVSIVKRGNLAFVFNFGDEPVSFPAEFSGKNLIGDALQGETISLPPQEYALIEILNERFEK